MVMPEFWQSLAKAIGWDGVLHLNVEVVNDEVEGLLFRTMTEKKETPEWKYHWRRFIDHLADGRGADEFFAGLDVSD